MALSYSWLLQVQTGVEVQGSCTPIFMADLLRAGQKLEIKVMDTVSSYTGTNRPWGVSSGKLHPRSPQLPFTNQARP